MNPKSPETLADECAQDVWNSYTNSADKSSDIKIILSTIRTALEQERGECEWTKELPSEQGSYWHWNGDEDSSPIHLEVMYSGGSDSFFLPAGQWGWTIAQDVSDVGGWWMPITTPKPPQTKDK